MADVNRQWQLARRPPGPVSAEDFKWAEAPVPVAGEGEILVRNLCLSCDPTQRSWMAGKTYMPAVKIGEVMRSIAAGVVRESRHPDYAVGDVVSGLFGWQDYCATTPAGAFGVTKIPSGVPVEAALGVFGLTGQTAYFGLIEVGQLRPGETVVVSGAAGATGSVVGQIAKIYGCNVVGFAGGREKCDHLVRELGFDAAIDYKTENIATRLRETCPRGVDVYFDNVGGRVLDTVLLYLAMKARVVVCGAISGYDSGTIEPPRNYMQLVFKRARMEGFLVSDYADKTPTAIAALARWVKEGRIKHECDVVEGLENAPAALARLFAGQNRGKQLVRVAGA
jgi:NADPH-dependent curcumin reductase CurA